MPHFLGVMSALSEYCHMCVKYELIWTYLMAQTCVFKICAVAVSPFLKATKSEESLFWGPEDTEHTSLMPTRWCLFQMWPWDGKEGIKSAIKIIIIVTVLFIVRTGHDCVVLKGFWIIYLRPLLPKAHNFEPCSFFVVLPSLCITHVSCAHWFAMKVSSLLILNRLGELVIFL